MIPIKHSHSGLLKTQASVSYFSCFHLHFSKNDIIIWDYSQILVYFIITVPKSHTHSSKQHLFPVLWAIAHSSDASLLHLSFFACVVTPEIPSTPLLEGLLYHGYWIKHLLSWLKPVYLTLIAPGVNMIKIYQAIIIYSCIHSSFRHGISHVLKTKRH